MKELNEKEFYEELTTCLPFFKEKIVTKHKNRTTISSIQSYILKSGYKINYIENNIDFDDILNLRSGLSLLYNLFFKYLETEGDVLIFTPNENTLNKNLGIIIPLKNLYEFLIDGHLSIYPDFFDVTTYDIYFYLYNQKIFYGFEHSSQPYYFNTPQ